MGNRGSRNFQYRTRLCFGLTILLAALIAGRNINVYAQTSPESISSPINHQARLARSERNESCLNCHNEGNLEGQFEDHTQIQLSVDKIEIENSIHGQAGLICTDCHKALAENGHQQEALLTYPDCFQEDGGIASLSCESLLVELPYQNERALSIALGASCSTCHEEQTAAAADNVHLRMLEQGNLYAPICTDCHGSHATESFREDRAQIALVCSKCHLGVYSSYRSSVHGEALDLVSNPDVPTCIDCHGVHNIQGPRELGFRYDSVYICEGCHGDQELMDKYGISTEVFRTYLTDIHWTSRSVFNLKGDNDSLSKPVCFDCHGIHTIRKTDDPLSSVSKENVQTTCRQCHDNDVSQFPSIWLSHYPPSIDNNPGWAVVYWVTRIIVPAGLVAYLLFILWNEGSRWLAKRRMNNID
jgi:hypothetical protein